jgi:hypothetical protein
LIAELIPNGALEEDIVATMARLIWRKQNLSTFRIAELARGHCEQLMNELAPEHKPLFDPAEREAAIQTAENQARNELGPERRLATGMFSPPHPGEILCEDCLKPLNLSVTAAAASFHLPNPHLPNARLTYVNSN